MLSEINLKVVDLKKNYKNISALNGVSFDYWTFLRWQKFST